MKQKYPISVRAHDFAITNIRRFSIKCNGTVRGVHPTKPMMHIPYFITQPQNL